MPRIVVRQKLRPVSVQRVPVSWRNTCWAWIISYSTTKMFHFFKFHIWFTSCAKISKPKIIPCLHTLNKYIFHQEALEWDIEFRPGWEQREKCQVCLHPTTDTWHVIGGSRFWRMDWEQLMCAAFDICHHRNSSFLSPALMLWWNSWHSPMLYP